MCVVFVILRQNIAVITKDTKIHKNIKKHISFQRCSLCPSFAYETTSGSTLATFGSNFGSNGAQSSQFRHHLHSIFA